jgi:hypothetical protein
MALGLSYYSNVILYDFLPLTVSQGHATLLALQKTSSFSRVRSCNYAIKSRGHSTQFA